MGIKTAVAALRLLPAALLARDGETKTVDADERLDLVLRQRTEGNKRPDDLRIDASWSRSAEIGPMDRVYAALLALHERAVEEGASAPAGAE